VVYFSHGGRLVTFSNVIAEGARSVEGAQVTVYRIKDPIRGDIPDLVRGGPRLCTVEKRNPRTYEDDTLGAVGLGIRRWVLDNTLGGVIQRRWALHSRLELTNETAGGRELRSTRRGRWTPPLSHMRRCRRRTA
jgi:hypothetical protein